MARYDQGGGCACGLEKVCDCFHSLSQQEKDAYERKELETKLKQILERQKKYAK
jgi:hypothetical protein